MSFSRSLCPSCHHENHRRTTPRLLLFFFLLYSSIWGLSWFVEKDVKLFYHLFPHTETFLLPLLSLLFFGAVVIFGIRYLLKPNSLFLCENCGFTTSQKNTPLIASFQKDFGVMMTLIGILITIVTIVTRILK